MKPGPPPRPRTQHSPIHEADLHVHIPGDLNQYLNDYCLRHRSNKRQVVADALRAYFDSAGLDAQLYRRLDRITIAQADTNARLSMLSQVVIEYLSYWFQLWPRRSQKETRTAQAQGFEMFGKYLSSLTKLLKNSPIDPLDPDSLEAAASRTARQPPRQR